MRVAGVALIALSLASCTRMMDRRSAAESASGGLRTDRLHGRAYLEESRIHPDLLMPPTKPGTNQPATNPAESTDSSDFQFSPGPVVP